MVQQPVSVSATGAAEGYRQQFLWVSGEMVRWEEATIPLTAATWMGLSSVFEGITAFRSASGQVHVFALEQHLRRFLDSIAFMRLTVPWSVAALTAAVTESIRLNGLVDDCYIQPVAAPMPSEVGFYPPPVPGQAARVYIPVGPRQSRLLSDRAYRCTVASWTRISDRTLPPRVKAIPNYQNSRLGQMDALLNGFDAPIFLNDRGTVAEGASACIAIVRNGAVVTPPVTAGILESITRSFFLQMLPEVLGIPVIEREIDRTELYVAREVFFLGTGAEVTPVVNIDHYPIGDGAIGALTRRIQHVYHDIVRAIDPRYPEWRTPV